MSKKNLTENIVRRSKLSRSIDKFLSEQRVHTKVDCYDHAHKQDYCRAIAYEGNKLIGKLEFSIYDGVAHIDIIETAKGHERKGVASKLVDAVVEEIGSYDKVEWGMTTESGAALKAMLDKKYGKKEEPPAADPEEVVAAAGGKLLDSYATGPKSTYVYVEFSDLNKALAFAERYGQHADPDKDLQDGGNKQWVEAIV